MKSETCQVISCRMKATTQMQVDTSLVAIRNEFFPESNKKKRVLVCDNHSKSIMAKWANYHKPAKEKV